MSYKFVSNNSLDAKYYREHSSMQFSLALESLKQINLSGNESILDLGCGDGQLTKHLSTLSTGDIVGVDPNPDMIKLATNSYQTKQLIFINSPAENIELDRQFNLVTSFSALHWIPNLDGFFKTVKSHLRQSGQVLILAFPVDSKYYNPILEALEKTPGAVLRTKLKHSEEYRRSIIDAGFQNISLNLEPNLAKHETFQDYCDFIEGWIALLARIPTRRQDIFKKKLFEIIKRDGFVKNSGQVEIPFLKLTLLIKT